MKILVLAALAGLFSASLGGMMVVHNSDGTVSRIELSDIGKITFDLSGGTLPAAALQHRVRMALANIFPNPFNPSTVIGYEIDAPGLVNARIVDARGVSVRVLERGRKEAGSCTVRWDGRDDKGSPAAAGTYLFCLEKDGRVLSKKLILVK